MHTRIHLQIHSNQTTSLTYLFIQKGDVSLQIHPLLRSEYIVYQTPTRLAGATYIFAVAGTLNAL